MDPARELPESTSIVRPHWVSRWTSLPALESARVRFALCRVVEPATPLHLRSEPHRTSRGHHSRSPDAERFQRSRPNSQVFQLQVTRESVPSLEVSRRPDLQSTVTARVACLSAKLPSRRARRYKPAVSVLIQHSRRTPALPS